MRTKNSGKLLIRLIIFLSFTFAVYSLTGAEDEPASVEYKTRNIVPNSGFEQPSILLRFAPKGWQFWGQWGNRAKSYIALDREIKTEGVQSLRIKGKEDVFIAAAMILKPVDDLGDDFVKPNKTYFLSGDIRRSALPSQPDIASLAVCVYVRGKDGKVSEGPVYKAIPRGAPGVWERVSTKFKTDQNMSRVAVICYNPKSDITAWFDNISLQEVEE